MKRLLLIHLVWVLTFSAFAQTNTLDLSFTSVVDQSYVKLDSILIQNRSRGCDTVLVYPDTVLSLTMVGINQRLQHYPALGLSQNYPNPFTDETTFSVLMPEKGNLSLLVHNLLGQKLTSYHTSLEAGEHYFTFSPGKDNWYILTAISPLGSTSRKMNSLRTRATTAKIDIISETEFKSTTAFKLKDNCFEFADGDTLLLVGYANFFAGALESGILDNPVSDHSYTFQFATNISCPGTPTVTYEGQTYTTIQILSQCWLKENLNVGTMIPGSQNMEDNGILEKYCYDNDTTNCTLYGGLYQWHEMMQYELEEGIQGICPPGWHLPTDEEWKVVEGAIDSQYGMGNVEWDSWDMRGSDVGHKIKSESGWITGFSGSDSHGFSLLPGGLRYFNDGNFHHGGIHANLWSSSNHINEYNWMRFVIGYIVESYRNSSPRENGFSVRCVKD